MKKMYFLVLALVIPLAAAAQSQRLVLVEEFTQASCSPCATQNVAFNALLAANTTKAVSIKYQMSGGVDPMNAQTATDVADRLSYYSVFSYPYGLTDGIEITDDCNGYGGAPACLDQADIDTRYNTTAPFTVAVTHTFSPTYDSVYITATITASQSYTSVGALIGHVVMVEQQINFATPPGSNGETDFYGVCRKMYPSAAGTTLPSTWTNGNSQTITIAAPVPNYIYDTGEIAIICFVQDNGDMNVAQTGISLPIPVTYDASVTSITGVPFFSCDSTINPSVTLTNTGDTTLTTCDIEYQIDANTPATYNWTGTITQGGTATVVLPAITVSNGAHILTVTSRNPNGSIDLSANYDSQSLTFVSLLSPTGSPAPVTNNLASGAFPYSGWAVTAPVAGGFTWEHDTTNAGALKLDCYSYPAGSISDFSVEPVDLTTATAASINFDVAHAQYGIGDSDALEILISTDCGVTWTSVYYKSGALLATTAPQSNIFIPTSNQWRAECIDLSVYAGQSKVFVMFHGLSDYGNNIFVDNIDINTNACSVGINEGVSMFSPITLFPNPANQSAAINFSLVENANVVVNVYNTLGELVSTEDKGTFAAGQQQVTMNTAVLANGMYTVELVAGQNKSVSRISVSH